MQYRLLLLLLTAAMLLGSCAVNLPRCQSESLQSWTQCQGEVRYASGDTYEGGWLNGKFHGYGIFRFANGDVYTGDYINGKAEGRGKHIRRNGTYYDGEFVNDKYHGHGRTGDGMSNGVGIWRDGVMIATADDSFFAIYMTVPRTPTGIHSAVGQTGETVTANTSSVSSPARGDSSVPQRRGKSEKQTPDSRRLSLQVLATQPDSNGVVTITIQTQTETSSLTVNGVEEGSSDDGRYVIRRVAKVDQETRYTVTATDVFGNKATSTFVVARQSQRATSAQLALRPERIKKAMQTDAVAIIIGIQNYRKIPRADFADQDARTFYDYAIRALGVRPENIRLLIDANADQAEILKAFKNWLPAQIKSGKTQVYIFYSGHGLPSADGKSLYLLPYSVDKDLLEDTALDFARLNAALETVNPKGVTWFIDSCYSGMTRTGETLLAEVRPVMPKVTPLKLPQHFTVITAAGPDQISSSSAELQHGLFSFYLMKAMEGDGDLDNDGRITAAELQTYVAEQVSKQALIMNRRQHPQLSGDGSRVLVGR